MPKNIVLLSDGTGNSAAKLAKTNVWRFYQSLDLSDPTQQIAYYDDGVGTSSFKPLAVVGGAFGYGLKRNILDLYTFLSRNYRPGDRIFCFGFSRGAFTVRALTGLINYQGVAGDPTEEGLGKKASIAYRNYRSERFKAAIPLDQIIRGVRELFFKDKKYRAKHPKVKVHFLGVWDTVAAYGLPIDELTRALNWFWRLYPADRNPPNNVKRICHAVAIDDERNTFFPRLFNEEGEPFRNERTTNIRQECVSQVWFAGMHSNVGGGYPDDGLASVPFEWMVEEAKAEGLITRPDVSVASHPPQKGQEARELLFLPNSGPPGKLYDSRRGLGGLYRYLPRKMEWLIDDTLDKNSPVIIPRPKIHESVFQRIAQGTDSYAPIVLPARYAVVQKNGDILEPKLEHGKQAQNRADEQEWVWDLVWYKRVAYFTSILVATVLLTFPMWMPATAACESAFCVVAPVINLVGGVLPNFLQPWIASYRSHPGWFVVFALGFAWLLGKGTKLQQRIFDRMRGIWEKRLQGGIEADVPNPPTSRLYHFRAHPYYRWFFLLMKRQVLPALFGIAALIAILGTVTRLLFLSASSAGWVCFPDNAQTTIDVRSPCPAIKLIKPLERGKRYKLMLQGKDLKDWTIPTSLNGFESGKLLWAAFFRRSFTEPWFRPIARIGEKGIDEYVLIPDEGTKVNGALISTITARRDGNLYVFVNDGVLPFPWQPFYNNNRGEIAVSVGEVIPNEVALPLAPTN